MVDGRRRNPPPPAVSPCRDNAECVPSAIASSRSCSRLACSYLLCSPPDDRRAGRAIRGRAGALQPPTASSDDRSGIDEVAASGDARAAPVIGALQDGRLLFSAESKRVFIREQPDRLIDAATGEPAAGAAPADLAPVRLNNRLRRIVEAALGGLTLLAPDPAQAPRSGAGGVQVADASALPALDAGDRQGNRCRGQARRLIEARAAVVLYHRRRQPRPTRSTPSP